MKHDALSLRCADLTKALEAHGSSPYFDDGENDTRCGSCGQYEGCGHKKDCFFELKRIALSHDAAHYSALAKRVECLERVAEAAKDLDVPPGVFEK